eukprot:Em0020g890a
MEPDIKLFCTVVGAEISAQKGGKIICFRIVWIVITFLLKIILQADNKNWYCNLGILHTEHLKNPQVQNRNLADWKKEGLIHEVFTTSQQPDCRWDDHVEIPIQKQADEYLVVEVWNQEKPNGEDSAGSKGLKKKQKESSYVGRIFYCLKPVSSDAMTKTLDLFSHSAKHKRGNIELLLSIKGKDAEKGSVSGKLKEHRALVTKIVLHESKEDSRRREPEDNLPPWDAQMDPAAESLIKFHAQFRSLSGFHQAAVRFSVLFSYHKANAIQMSVLIMLVDSISKLPLDSHLIDSAELSHLFDNLQEILRSTLNVLNDHLVEFDTKNASSVGKLKEHLLLVKKLYSMQEFVNSLPSNLRSITDVVENSIQKSVVSWYSMYSASLSVSSSNELDESSEETLAALSGIFKHVLNECHALRENVAPTFMKLFEVDYLAHVFFTLDSHFEHVASLLKSIPAFKASKEDRLLGVTYQLYVTFQELKQLNQASVKRFPEEQQLNSCHLWFIHFVGRWINLATTKCKKGIIEAIKDDKAIAITEDIGYSSSLVDTMTLLHNMVVFWKQLKWPDPEQAYSGLSVLIVSITDAALYYAVEVFKKADKCFSKDGKLVSTVQLCIILNNMQAIRDKLSPPDLSDGISEPKPVGIIDELGLQELFDWLEQEKGIGLKLKEFVNRSMHNTADDIHNKMSIGISHLEKQYIPVIRKFTEDILPKHGEAPSIEASYNSFTMKIDCLTDQQGLQHLEEYFNTTLKVLSENLLFPTFKLVMKKVWEATLKILMEIGNTHLTKPSQWQACRDIALSLKEYFHAEGDGLIGDDLDSPAFKTFLFEVNLRSQPTSSLVLKCCSNLAAQQMTAVDLPTNQQQFGELSLTIGYLKTSSVIEVKVLEARNIPVDKICFMPSVELQLLPSILFEDNPKELYRTKKYKQQTQNPQFRETFQIPSHSSLMQLEGTILSLVASNYDSTGKDNFLGLCVVPCNIIPCFVDASELGQHPMMLNLPLFHITKSDVLLELVTRHQRSDEVASELFTTFVKKLKANL